ncbi:MAG: MFS transporter [Arachnia sp.]
MGAHTTASPTSRAAITVWLVAVGAYAVGILQRSSLGVAGIQAAEHFGSTVAAVSMFVIVQIVVYTLMQIPSGLLIDRFGSRVMLVAGSLVMGGGQALMALTDEMGLAVAARILLGTGDSAMFGSVLRLLPAWFAPARVPLLSQLTGLSGQLGQLTAVAALVPLLNTAGWRTAFGTIASASALAAAAVVIAVRDAPAGHSVQRSSDRLRELPAMVTKIRRSSATQLGFWVHFTAGFSLNTFLLIWGIPFLVVAQQRSQTEATSLVGLSVFVGLFVGPVVGHLTAKHPLRRSNLALGLIGLGVALWAVVLAWPEPAPLWLLVALVIAISAGGPGTAVGFDFPRTQLPLGRLGLANGIVIMGSFTGTIVMIGLISGAVTILGGGADATRETLTIAMSLQFPVYALGLTMILRTRARLRREMAASGVIVPSWPEVYRRIRRRRA